MRFIAGACVVGCALVGAGAGAQQSQSPVTHRLEATPATVAYGYYWSEAKPALRIASGDIIDVDTLLTNSPSGPGRHAGNLDNNELIAGSTLYIPVFVPGALFEIGDGHAAQGDGEVDQTAIETSLRGRLQLTVRKDMKLTWPRAETATDFISMATDPDLAVATRLAIQEMVDFVAATRKLTKHQAYQLVSIAGNVAVTQLVDKPNLGVHVRLPKSVFAGRK